MLVKEFAVPVGSRDDVPCRIPISRPKGLEPRMRKPKLLNSISYLSRTVIRRTLSTIRKHGLPDKVSRKAHRMGLLRNTQGGFLHG